MPTPTRAPLALLEEWRGDGSPSPSRPGFAWRATLANTWILVGLFIDGYFHIHDPELESFFTPWHAVLYSGVLAAVVVIALEVRAVGRVPDGYLPSIAGGVVVGTAGFVDMVWHETLGVEADLAALLSPPHLLLITAGTLVFAGPLRAALRTRSTVLDLPAALSVAAVLTGLAFFSQYANPFTVLFPLVVDGGSTVVTSLEGGATTVAELREVAGLAGVVVMAALLGGGLAVLRARTSLPAGAVLAVVVLPALAMTTLRSTYVLVPAVLLAGVAAELLGRRLRPAHLGALGPALLVAAWAVTLAATRDVAWNLELLSGAVGSAAAAGFLAGWLVQQCGSSRP